MNPEGFAKWKREMADQRKACLACEQEEHEATRDYDWDGYMPPVERHEGEFCKKRAQMFREAV